MMKFSGRCITDPGMAHHCDDGTTMTTDMVAAPGRDLEVNPAPTPLGM